MVKVGQTHRRRDAGEVRDGGATRDRATGHVRGRAWARWKALAPARRTVAVAGPGVAEVDGGELRSSRGRQLQEARDDGARGNRISGSPRSCRDG